jgi:Fic family protein
MKKLNRIFTPDNEILKMIAEIDEFKGKWAFLKMISPERLISLKKVATIESIASSTRIEGSELSDEEVNKLLSNINKNSFKNRDEQEVIGYAEVMDIIFLSFNELNITENYIKQLHSILLKYSTKDERHRGDYKKISNSVEAFDSNGKSIGVIFKTATPFNTPYRMEDLINWLKKVLIEKEFHPLIIIAMFIVEFLEIHPFQDGNGRLSRILTTLLLLKKDYTYVPYSSIESIIEDNKDSYYSTLRRTQKTFQEDKIDYYPWVRFFLGVLIKQKNNLEIKMQNILNTKYEGLPSLSVNILEIIKNKQKVKIADIVKQTQGNRNTIKLHIKNLLKKDYIKSFGQGKGTWYEISE